MADPYFLRILDRIVLELNTNRPADVPEVTKRRLAPGVEIREPRMAVFLGDEGLDPPRGQNPNDPIARRRLAVAVQCAAPADDIEELDAAVAPMLAWATKVLGRSRLDGLAFYVRETSTQRTTQFLDVAVIVATQVYECSYQTRRDDQTARL